MDEKEKLLKLDIPNPVTIGYTEFTEEEKNKHRENLLKLIEAEKKVMKNPFIEEE